MINVAMVTINMASINIKIVPQFEGNGYQMSSIKLRNKIPNHVRASTEA